MYFNILLFCNFLFFFFLLFVHFNVHCLLIHFKNNKYKYTRNTHWQMSAVIAKWILNHMSSFNRRFSIDIDNLIGFLIRRLILWPTKICFNAKSHIFLKFLKQTNAFSNKKAFEKWLSRMYLIHTHYVWWYKYFLYIISNTILMSYIFTFIT